MGYLIQLEVYEGPFDLLLDLISKNEVDIWDIPIASITEQYLEYLYSLQEQNLAITGEFLVMAATLIRIKSRMLLPPEPVEEDELDEDFDPRRELVEQLLRYKFIKEVAEFLQGRYEQSTGLYTRGQPAAKFDFTPIYTNPVGDLTLRDLNQIYGSLKVEIVKEERVHSVPTRISVQEKLARVRIQLVGQPRVSFGDLLQDQTPAEVVLTFLAVLELVRLGEIAVVQEKSFGNINIVPYAIELEVQA
ncbi:MAG: segregation/condensation protein A [Bacillota bacterium]|nr:segregation/condensation protein A [Bacillota bacterium]HHU62188.1 segregation/condensation protein A [Natronincola sp.]